jgi:hypothetical protein
MPRGIGSAQACLPRQRFRSSRRLAQEVKRFQSGRTCDRLAHPAKLFMDSSLHRCSRHEMLSRSASLWGKVINYSINQ